MCMQFQQAAVGHWTLTLSLAIILPTGLSTCTAKAIDQTASVDVSLLNDGIGSRAKRLSLAARSSRPASQRFIGAVARSRGKTCYVFATAAKKQHRRKES